MSAVKDPIKFYKTEFKNAKVNSFNRMAFISVFCTLPLIAGILMIFVATEAFKSGPLHADKGFNEVIKQELYALIKFHVIDGQQESPLTKTLVLWEHSTKVMKFDKVHKKKVMQDQFTDFICYIIKLLGPYLFFYNMQRKPMDSYFIFYFIIISFIATFRGINRMRKFADKYRK